MELRNTELAVDLRQCREQVVQQQKCWVVEQLRTMYEAKTEKVKHKAADSEHALSKETTGLSVFLLRARRTNMKATKKLARQFAQTKTKAKQHRETHKTPARKSRKWEVGQTETMVKLKKVKLSGESTASSRTTSKISSSSLLTLVKKPMGLHVHHDQIKELRLM
ncbi:hypothetical protein PRNP1_010191 [Phytophthora ramorum]